MEKFYITTPIYYPSGKWHIGSAYTTVLADAVARYKRLDGFDVFYLTGTDEHGQKIETRAKESQKSPKEFVDEIVANLQSLWQVMDISFDKFIRTTDEEHKQAVKKIFTMLYEKGDIYKSEYEGWYCTPCESFWTETQVKEGKCPDCGREVQKSKEESYFFRLSKYADRLTKLLEENSDFLLPKSRVNEMVNNFLKSGLEDIAVSRTSFKWGVEVPFDENHVIYVWIDALSNYITALGYLSENDSKFKKYWPCDYHLMAKEIVRFHSIIWPAMLMALDLPLPKRVYGHGWLLMGGDKLSKSKSGGAIKDVVDPFILCERYGADALRYILLKMGPYAQDTPYVNDTFLSNYNIDLANDLGNLLSRTLSMIIKYFDGKVSRAAEFSEPLDKELIAMMDGLKAKLDAHIEKCDLPSYLFEVMTLVRRCNKYIDETMPWQLFKDENLLPRLQQVMYVLAEGLRISTIYLQPVLTKISVKIFDQLNTIDRGFECAKFGYVSIFDVKKGDNIFPRLDIAAETAFLEETALKK